MTGDPLLERVVSHAEDGRRADVVVASWLGEPRSRTQARLTAGDVRVGAVDGEPAAKSLRVRAGDRIVVLAPPPAEPVAAPAAVPVRWRDEHFAVVAKPAGMVVHRGAGTGPGATLVDALTAMGLPLAAGDDDDERPGIVHRLDRGTSGLLVVALSGEARWALIEMFRRHAVQRRYWAIVDGHPDPPSATIDAPIARSTRNRTRFSVAPGGRRAVTHYDVSETGFGASVLTVRLETGRTHQVRAHMAAVGHPVSGDRVYGASPAVASRLRLERPALHAASLAFTHPVTAEEIAFDEPLPADLIGAQRLLRGQQPEMSDMT